MAKPPARRAGRAPPPRIPLRRAILRFLIRAALWLLRRLGFLWARAVDAAIWLALWPWRHPRSTLKAGWSGIFRIATLLSVGYLVFDRIYETGATLSSPLSDPADPFRLPFTITNNSHLFSLRNLKWTCRTQDVESNTGAEAAGFPKILRGSQSILLPGQILNIDCNIAGPTSHLIRIPEQIVRADLEIELLYDADIDYFLGHYLWHREPPATQFRWVRGAIPSEWLKGPLAQ